jgi:hypothetical protein
MILPQVSRAEGNTALADKISTQTRHKDEAARQGANGYTPKFEGRKQLRELGSK